MIVSCSYDLCKEIEYSLKKIRQIVDITDTSRKGQLTLEQ